MFRMHMCGPASVLESYLADMMMYVCAEGSVYDVDEDELMMHSLWFLRLCVPIKSRRAV